MNEIRDLYEEHCFLGYRRITEMLKRKTGHMINRKKVLRLMQKMGLRAVYPKKRLTKRAKGHKVYPYLLRDNAPKNPGDCWGVDITYIRVCGGYAYLTALIDWISRRIMGWCLSPFLETSSCLEALNAALKVTIQVPQRSSHYVCRERSLGFPFTASMRASRIFHCCFRAVDM